MDLPSIKLERSVLDTVAKFEQCIVSNDIDEQGVVITIHA
jgi:hypothetical protein